MDTGGEGEGGTNWETGIDIYTLLLLLLLSHFSRVQLCATPETAAHQAPPSLGFSSQEHWSGLLFPSPMHESEKWEWSHSVVSDPQWPHGLQPTRLLHPRDFPGKSTGVGCHCLLRIYTLLCVKHIASMNLLCSMGSSTQCSVMTYVGEIGWGSPRGTGEMCTYSWFTSLHSRNEQNIVNQLYSNWKKEKTYTQNT